MRKFLVGLMMFACLSLVLAIPAFAETTTGRMNNDGNPLTGNTLNRTDFPNTFNRMTTDNGIFNGTTTNGNFPNRINDTRIGNGTGTIGTYGTNGTYDSTRMNANRTNTTNMTTRANNRVRAMDTTPRRNFDWGWLGLLGLFGLAGMRSRNRDEVR